MSNTIQVSIWGIKDGFEPNGIFHTHDLPDVKRLWNENDSFRDFSSQDCFIIQYTESHVIISLYHPKIKEYAAPGKQRRPGYVVISLIIPGGKCFTNSPLGVLKRILYKYKEEIVDANLRNMSWTSADVAPFTQALSTQLGPIGRRPERKYLEFVSEDQIADLLKCEKAYTNFEELLLVPQGTHVRGRTPLNLQLEEGNYIKQQEEEARRKEAEQQLNEKVRNEEEHIRTLCAENKWDEALNRFRSFNEQTLLSADLQQKMNAHAGKLRQREEDIKKREADERKLKPLNDAIRNGDAARAVDLYDSLFFQDIVPLELNTLIYQFKKELAQEREEIERERKEKERKKKLYIFSGAGSFGFLIVFLSFSYLMSWPTFLYDDDGDGIVNAEDTCPNVPGLSKFDGCKDTDGDGVGDHEDACINKKGEKKFQGCIDTDKDGIPDNEDNCPSDSLNKCLEKNIPNNEDSLSPTDPIPIKENNRQKVTGNVDPKNILLNKFVWFVKEKWYYANNETDKGQSVKTCESYKFLNERFGKDFKCPEVQPPKETVEAPKKISSITTKKRLNDFRNDVANCYEKDKKCTKCKEWQELKFDSDSLSKELSRLNNTNHPCTIK